MRTDPFHVTPAAGASLRPLLVGTALSTLLVALLVLPAAAQQKNPCRGEVEKFCKDVPRGAGRTLSCLHEHFDELSKPCQQYVASRKAKRDKKRARRDHPGRVLGSMCAADVKKLCSGIPAGQGRIQQCLKEHRDELSENCRQALDQFVPR